jgi:hypothetical protein
MVLGLEHVARQHGPHTVKRRASVGGGNGLTHPTDQHPAALVCSPVVLDEGLSCDGIAVQEDDDIALGEPDTIVARTTESESIVGLPNVSYVHPA